MPYIRSIVALNSVLALQGLLIYGISLASEMAVAVAGAWCSRLSFKE
jgi:hypothetical protein